MLLQTILFVHPTLAHYHYPRLQALGRAASHSGVRVANIELADSMQAYPWGAQGQAETFQNLRLFPGQPLEALSTSQMKSALQPRLAELQPQVVFLYGYSLGIFRWARDWCDRQAAAAVLISDSNDFDKPRYRVFEYLKSRLVRRYDAAFVGGTSSSLYLQKLGLPAPRIVPGYDVIDVGYFARYAEKRRRDLPHVRQKWQLPQEYFLVVARLVPEKNLPGLLAAYARYHQQLQGRREPWPLVLCGSGPQEAELRKRLGELPAAVRSNIHLLGHIRQPEIIDLFAAAACLVLPSLSESWGLVVNEALACSLPVLVTNRAGCARDLVQDGFNGWTFNPHDPDELTSRLVQMTLLEADAREQMGNHSRARIADWDLDRFASGAMQCARIALKHKHPSRLPAGEIPLAKEGR